MATAEKQLHDDVPGLTDPDRVHYEIGVLLSAEDFQAEQSYHRGRLARALQYTSGAGTLAGLAAEHEPAVAGPEATEERLRLHPGLAADPFGRLIEVGQPQCIRLARWFAEQDAALLRQSWRAADGAFPGAPEGYTADLSLSFVPCERGRTPSFAAGPFDGLDAVTAERVRDGFALALTLRTGADITPPPSPWQPVADARRADRAAAVRAVILSSWRNPNDAAATESSVLIARLVIEGPDPAGVDVTRAPGDPVTVNNDLRPFVIPTAALATLAALR